MPSDPIHNDRAKIHANAHDFTRLLERAAEGHALWHPTTSGRIGDCGVIIGGSFRKSFNVYDRSPGLDQPLRRPNPAYHFEQPREDSNTRALCSTLLHSVSFDGRAQLTAGQVPINMSFAPKWSREESSLAYLRFLGDFRHTEVLGNEKYKELRSYIERYWSNIRLEFWPGVDVVVVYGVTRAAGWVSAIAHGSNTELEVSAGLSAPSAGLGLALHLKKKEDSGPSELHTPEAILNAEHVSDVQRLYELQATEVSAKAAPPISNHSPPDEYCDHCIVLQLIRVKSRRWLPQMFKASIKAAESEIPNSQVQTPSTSSSSGRSVQVQCKATAAGTGYQSSSGDGFQELYDVLGEQSEGHKPGLDGPGIAETNYEDLLSIILGRILNANDEIESVLGSWKDIENFCRDYGDLRRDTDFTAELSVTGGKKTARIVKLMAMDNDGEGHDVEHVKPLFDPVLLTGDALSPHLDMDSRRRADAENAGPDGDDDVMVIGTRPSTPYIAFKIEYDDPEAIPGSHGAVFRGNIAGQPHELVAVKQLRYSSKDEHKALEKEISALMRIKHQHILSIFGLVEHFRRICFVTPWAENGTVRGYLRKNPGADREKIIREVAAALEYLHSGRALPNGTVVVHGHIRLNNVLISSDGSALLCDIGLCASHCISRISSATPGEVEVMLAYMAPELLVAEMPLSVAGDVFAFGRLVYAILGGKLSQIAPTAPGMAQAGSGPPRIAGIRDELWEVACDCWKALPEDRPTMKQVYDRLIAL